MKYVTKSLVRKSLPKKHDWSHKGDFGRLLIIGGSKTYYGAPVLSALAALRTGCDLVRIVAPEKSAEVYASISPDLMVEPIPGHNFNNWHARGILDLAKDYDAVLIGPGLGIKRETLSFVHNFLQRLDKPCVIDADAIKAISSNKKILKSNCVLTPHSMEFQLLTDQKPSNNLRERSEQVKLFTKHLGCTILLKGHIDIISNGKETLLNKTGTPFMTKGGTGDVLAGICGALLAMGFSPIAAASSAAYLNGLAGEAIAKRLGQGLLASDVVNNIPSILKRL